MKIKIQVLIEFQRTRQKKESPGKPKPTEAIKNTISIINQVRK